MVGRMQLTKLFWRLNFEKLLSKFWLPHSLGTHSISIVTFLPLSAKVK